MGIIAFLFYIIGLLGTIVRDVIGLMKKPPKLRMYCIIQRVHTGIDMLDAILDLLFFQSG